MREVPISKGLVTLVDDKDYAWVTQWKWKALGGKYPYVFRTEYQGGGRHKAKYSTFLLHRALLGVTDEQVLVDHRDHNVLNNQRYNLRRSTKRQNNQNVAKNMGRKGVYQRNQKFYAHIRVDGKLLHIPGSFATEVEAAKAYDKAAKKYFGAFAHMNYPKKGEE